MTTMRGTRATKEETAAMLADHQREKSAESEIEQRRQYVTTKTTTGGSPTTTGHKHSQTMLREAAEHALDWLEESLPRSEQPTGLVEELSDALSYAKQHGINVEHDAGLRDESGRQAIADARAVGRSESARKQQVEQPSDPVESSEHTPTPWHVFEGGNFVRIAAEGYDEYVERERYLGGPLSIADMEYNATENYDSDHDRAMANAELIVRCVNTHATLVAALEQARNVLYDDDPATAKAVEMVDAALKQARGGE